MILRIQTIMDHYGLSVSAFADEIGVQRSSISHLLNGRNRPSLDFVMKLIAAYPEVNLYWLLKGEGSFPWKGEVDEADKAPLESSPQEEGPKEVPGTMPDPGDGEVTTIVVFYGDGSFRSYDRKRD